MLGDLAIGIRTWGWGGGEGETRKLISPWPSGAEVIDAVPVLLVIASCPAGQCNVDTMSLSFIISYTSD